MDYLVLFLLHQFLLNHGQQTSSLVLLLSLVLCGIRLKMSNIMNITKEKIEEIALTVAHRRCTNYKHVPVVDDIKYSFSDSHMKDFVYHLLKAIQEESEIVGYQIQGGKMNERLLQPWEYELLPEVQKWKVCCVPLMIHPVTERKWKE